MTRFGRYWYTEHFCRIPGVILEFTRFATSGIHEEIVQ